MQVEDNVGEPLHCSQHDCSIHEGQALMASASIVCQTLTLECMSEIRDCMQPDKNVGEPLHHSQHMTASVRKADAHGFSLYHLPDSDAGVYV